MCITILTICLARARRKSIFKFVSNTSFFFGSPVLITASCRDKVACFKHMSNTDFKHRYLTSVILEG